jgi:Microtubule-binding protein MIP-T3 CH-like domain
MSEAELPAAIAAARLELSTKIVQDVSLLTDRVLARPPFAFICWLFDCAKGSTGFGTGLFTEQELLPTTLADKRGRLSYLVKVKTREHLCCSCNHSSAHHEEQYSPKGFHGAATSCRVTPTVMLPS